ncbi:MAG: hypothetical protein GY823_08345 [Flavobacteriaceae bacterium]|nr:hypothetical protein [Flavobacteriaceae bacterium]
MKVHPLIFLFIITVNSFAQKNSHEQNNSNTPFHVKIKALQSGEISSFSLCFKDSIKIKQSIGEKIDDRDADRHKSGFIWAEQLKAISASSICEITDNYTLLIVEDKFKQLRALTVSPEGVPIESILIYDNLLYLSKDWYEYEARRYSPTRLYHYNPKIHEFTYSTIFKIREPQYEEVLIDLNDHEDETTNKQRIKVNEEGFFTEPIYEHINSRKIDFDVFTLKSPFFEKISGHPIDHKSDGNKDNLHKIYLDRDQSMELLSNHPVTHDIIIKIIPKTKGEIDVLQRYTNGLIVNGDGDYCELEDLIFMSNWETLDMKNDLVSIKKYSNDEKKITPEISVKDLKKKIKTECGVYHLSLTDYINRKEDISSLVQPREVILKVNFTNAESNITTTEFIVFVIANGC